MKSRIARAVVKALPIVYPIVRVLFAEGATAMEKAIQKALRTVAQAILERDPQCQQAF